MNGNTHIYIHLPLYIYTFPYIYKLFRDAWNQQSIMYAVSIVNALELLALQPGGCYTVVGAWEVVGKLFVLRKYVCTYV
jgi:hypothetical protein